MAVKRIRFDDLTPAPWKNGLGITREIRRYERNAQLAARLSIADVEEDCAFSQFPGLQRILTVLTGDGFQLTGDGMDVEARPLRPLPFSGDTPLKCSLHDGPVRDFNVIYAPDLCEVSVEMLGATSERRMVSADHSSLALFCVEGACDIGGIQLDRFDTGFTDADVVVEGGVLVLVRVSMLPA